MLVQDVPASAQTHYMKDLLYGLQLPTMKQHWLLYTVYMSICILGIAQQVFVPYFIIYFEFYPGIKDYALLLAAILIFASLMSIIEGRPVDRFDKKGLLIGSIVVYLAGMMAIYLPGVGFKTFDLTAQLVTGLASIIMIRSYLISMVVLNSAGRDLLPVSHIGEFSGICMFFFIMIPMVAGPFIGHYQKQRLHLHGRLWRYPVDADSRGLSGRHAHRPAYLYCRRHHHKGYEKRPIQKSRTTRKKYHEQKNHNRASPARRKRKPDRGRLCHRAAFLV